jgi:hypothetical protein
VEEDMNWGESCTLKKRKEIPSSEERKTKLKNIFFVEKLD